MSCATLSRSEAAGYRHEAMLVAGTEGFLAGTVPFLREAVDAGEPTYVVVGAPRIAALRGALDDEGGVVRFADMAEVGSNPARIIPAWQDFVDEHAGRRIRGIGEPISSARRPAELVECQRHEALLNLCFAGSDFWLVCPYDIEALDEAVIAEAQASHAIVWTDGRPEISPRFRPDQTPDPGAALPAIPADAAVRAFSFEDLGELRGYVGALAVSLDRERRADLIFAVHELATNSVRHGGGQGRISLWQEEDALVCEVADAGRIADPLAGRVRPSHEALNGRGLWLANQLCDLVQIRSLPGGGAVRVHVRTS